MALDARPNRWILAAALTVLGPGIAHAQSTVGELLEKGGAQVTREAFLEMLPLRIQTEWPNRQGEEELMFTADGKISGKGYHYNSRTESPASGSWKIEDDGKVCTPKTFTAWNSSTNQCWYFYRLDNAYFGTQKTDPGSRVGKIQSMGKLSSAQ